MHPALRFFALTLATIFVSNLLATSAAAQGPAKLLPSTPVSSLRFASDRIADPSADDLRSFGRQGTIIEQARRAVISILSEENSCSAWFHAAEPHATEQFRSLRFALDSSANSEIKKLEVWQSSAVFYQPYVARTGQNVGWGSTITINAKGAFFKDWAPVRVIVNLQDKGYVRAFRRLVVGNFDGATDEARILTLLHEWGHELDMLPIDSGVPSGPELSTTNSELVMHHCGAKIREMARRPAVSLDSALLLSGSPVALEEEHIDRKAKKH